MRVQGVDNALPHLALPCNRFLMTLRLPLSVYSCANFVGWEGATALFPWRSSIMRTAPGTRFNSRYRNPSEPRCATLMLLEIYETAHSQPWLNSDMSENTSKRPIVLIFRSESSDIRVQLQQVLTRALSLPHCGFQDGSRDIFG